MKPRRTGLFSVAKVSEKQDRAHNVTGQRRQQKSDAGNKKGKNDQGSHELKLCRRSALPNGFPQSLLF